MNTAEMGDIPHGQSVASKRESEKRIVGEMIALYCRRRHHTAKGCLCRDCEELTKYAKERSDKCPFMENKTFCSNCRVHCYKPQMREEIRTVMRYSGPRMIFTHPVMAIRHVVLTKRERRRMDGKEHDA